MPSSKNCTELLALVYLLTLMIWMSSEKNRYVDESRTSYFVVCNLEFVLTLIYWFIEIRILLVIISLTFKCVYGLLINLAYRELSRLRGIYSTEIILLRIAAKSLFSFAAAVLAVDMIRHEIHVMTHRATDWFHSLGPVSANQSSIYEHYSEIEPHWPLISLTLLIVLFYILFEVLLVVDDVIQQSQNGGMIRYRSLFGRIFVRERSFLDDPVFNGFYPTVLCIFFLNIKYSFHFHRLVERERRICGKIAQIRDEQLLPPAPSPLSFDNQMDFQVLESYFYGTTDCSIFRQHLQTLLTYLKTTQNMDIWLLGVQQIFTYNQNHLTSEI